jgi:hypothetical protein
MEAYNTLNAWRTVSFQESRKQSASFNVICTVAGQCRELTSLPQRLIQIRHNQSWRDETMSFKWVITKDRNRHCSPQFTVWTVSKSLTAAGTLSHLVTPVSDFDTLPSAVGLLSACPIPYYRQHITFVTSHSASKHTESPWSEYWTFQISPDRTVIC